MNTRSWMTFGLLAALALGGACGTGGGGGDLAGIINGRIIKEASILDPVQITVKGTSLSTEADSEGRFFLEGVPLGEQMLRIGIEAFWFELEVDVTVDEVTELLLRADGPGREEPDPMHARVKVSPLRGVAPVYARVHGEAMGGERPFDFNWEYNGGRTSTVDTLNVVLEDPGVHNFPLTVRDRWGAEATASNSITVQAPRSLKLTPRTPGPYRVGESVIFDVGFEGTFSNEGDPTDLSKLHYYYMFTDGTYDASGSDTWIEHTFQHVGWGSASVYCHTGDRQQCWIGASTPVKVDGEPTPVPRSEEEIMSLVTGWGDLVTDDSVQDMDNDFLRGIKAKTAFMPYVEIYDREGLDWSAHTKLRVDWDDGSVTEGNTPHTFFDEGTFEVRIRTSVGDFVTYDRMQLVEIRAPLEITSGPEMAFKPGTLASKTTLEEAVPELCLHETHPFDVEHQGGKGPYTYQWTFGDGTGSTEKSTEHLFTRAGKHIVSVQVVDAEGEVDRASQVFDVRERLRLAGLSWVTCDRTGTTNCGFKAKLVGGCPETHVEYRFDGEDAVEQHPEGPGLRRTLEPGREYVVQVRAWDDHGEDTGWKEYRIALP